MKIQPLAALVSERLSALAETFPVLRGAPGVRPFDPYALADWALRQALADDPDAGRIEDATVFVLGIAYDPLGESFQIDRLGVEVLLADPENAELVLGMDERVQHFATAALLMHQIAAFGGPGDLAALVAWARAPWTAHSAKHAGTGGELGPRLRRHARPEFLQLVRPEPGEEAPSARPDAPERDPLT